MGRLRTAVRTLADVDLPPDELLTHLDDVVNRLAAEAEVTGSPGEPAVLGATCTYAVYDPIAPVSPTRGAAASSWSPSSPSAGAPAMRARARRSGASSSSRVRRCPPDTCGQAGLDRAAVPWDSRRPRSGGHEAGDDDGVHGLPGEPGRHPDRGGQAVHQVPAEASATGQIG